MAASFLVRGKRPEASLLPWPPQSAWEPVLSCPEAGNLGPSEEKPLHLGTLQAQEFYSVRILGRQRLEGECQPEARQKAGIQSLEVPQPEAAGGFLPARDKTGINWQCLLTSESSHGKVLYQLSWDVNVLGTLSRPDHPKLRPFQLTIASRGLAGRSQTRWSWHRLCPRCS